MGRLLNEPGKVSSDSMRRFEELMDRLGSAQNKLKDARSILIAARVMLIESEDDGTYLEPVEDLIARLGRMDEELEEVGS